MKMENIARCEINWMEGWANDPHITFVLKRDRKLAPIELFRYRQFGNLFFAEYENEVRFVSHSSNDHNGFGGHIHSMQMHDGYDPSEHGFRIGKITLWEKTGGGQFGWENVDSQGWVCCNSVQTQWGSGGGSHLACCWYDPILNTVHIKGPWSSGEVFVKKATGVSCISVATLEGPSRESIRNPEWYQRQRRKGIAYTGTPFATSYRVDFVQEVVDRLAPHAELWQGDYGWTVKLRGMEPKNPKRRGSPIGHAMLSGDQNMAVCG